MSKAYLKGFFLFDVVTSFPVSFFELSAQIACSKEIEGQGPVSYTLHPMPYNLYPISYTSSKEIEGQGPVSYTLHPMPYSLYPISYTSSKESSNRPLLYTLHTTHYTLQTTPNTLFPIPAAKSRPTARCFECV